MYVNRPEQLKPLSVMMNRDDVDDGGGGDDNDKMVTCSEGSVTITPAMRSKIASEASTALLP